MRKHQETNLADFINGLDTSSEPFRAYERDRIDQTKDAMRVLGELTLVLDFLREHGAPQNLSDAVDTVMYDVEDWVNADIQMHLLRQIPNYICLRIPKAFLNLEERVRRFESVAS